MTNELTGSAAAQELLGQDPTNIDGTKRAEFDIWTDTAPLLWKKFNRGKDITMKSYFSSYMAANIGISDEEELQQLKDFKIDDSMDEDYKSAPWAIRALSDAGEMVPGIGTTVGTGLTVGTGTALSGLPVSAGLAKIPGAGPLLGVTAETTEFGAGFIIGNTQSIYTQSFGEIYSHLRETGFSRNTARTLATVYGGFNAGLEYIGFKTLGKVAESGMNAGQKKVIEQALKDPRFKKVQDDALAKLGLNYVENVITEPTTEAIQTFNENLAEMTAAYIEQSKAPTFSDWGKAMEESKQSFLTTIGAALFLGAGTGAISYAAGAGGEKAKQLTPEELKEAAAALEGKSIAEITQTMKETMEAQAVSESNESIEFTQSEDGGFQLNAVKNVELPAEDTAQSDANVTPEETPANPLDGTPVGDLLNAVAEETQAALDTLYPDTFGFESDTPGEITNARPVAASQELTDMTPQETQSRSNQIASDLRLLRVTQRQLESEFTRKDKTGQSTTATLKKLESVMDAREQLEFEQELLESGLLTREDVASKTGKQRMSVVAKLMDKIKTSATRMTRQRERLEQKVQLAEKQGFKKGQTAEQRTIKAIQSQLLQIINAATPNRKHRSRLRNLVNKVTNNDQFNKATKEIGEELRKLQQEDIRQQTKVAKDKVVKEIEKLLTKGKVKQQSGHPTAKLDPDTVRKLNLLKNHLKDQAKGGTKTEEALNDFMSEYGAAMAAGDSHLVPTEALEAYQMAVMASGFKNRSLMELNIIKGNIAQMVEDSKAKIAEKQAAMKEQRAQELETALTSVDALEYEAREGEASQKERSQQFKDSLGTQILTWDQFCEFISFSDPTHALRDLLDPTASDRMFHAASETQKLGLLDAMQRALRAAGYNTDIQQKVEEDSNTKYEMTYTTQKGAPKTVTYSRASLIDAWMKMQDESLRDAMRDTETGNGWTFKGDAPDGTSFQEVVEAILSPEDMIVGESLFEFYTQYHARVNEKYREKFGVDLPMRDNYSPVDRKGYDVNPADETLLQFMSVLPGSAKTRTANLYRVNPRNAYNVVSDHIGQWEHFITRDDFLGTLQHVVKNAAFRDAVSDRHGAESLHVMDEYVKRFVMNDAMPSDRAHPIWAALRSDMARFGLGFKVPYQMATQMTSGMAMWRNLDPQHVVSGIAGLTQNIKGTEDAFRSSPILKHRFKDGTTFDLAAALNRQGIIGAVVSKFTGQEGSHLTPAQHNAITKIMFAGIRYGDAAAVRVFGGVLYNAELAKGATPEQALMTVEREVTRTQQSDAVSQIPHIYATNPTLYSIIGQFTLQPLQLYGHSMIAARDLAANPTVQGVAQMAKKAALLWAGPGLLFGLVKAMPSLFMPPDDDPERTWEAVQNVIASTATGPLSGVPFLGSMIETAWWFAQGKRIRGQADPFTEMVINANDMWNAWERAWDDDEDISNITEDGDEAEIAAQMKTGRFVGQSLGIPATTFNIPLMVRQSLDKGDYVGAAFALGGFSPGSIEKRWSEETESIEETDSPGFDIQAFFNEGIADTAVPEENNPYNVNWDREFLEGLSDTPE